MIETTASIISEELQEPRLSKNSKERQNRIDQQASQISTLEAQNMKLTQLLDPKFLVNTITQAMASSLNISRGNKPQNNTNGMSGYTGKPYLEKPWPLQLAPGTDESLNPEVSCQYCKDTSHLKENCIKLNRRLALENRQPEKSNSAWLPKSLENWDLLWSQTKLKERRRVVLIPLMIKKDFICQLNNASILVETKNEIMQCTVAKCPKVCISAHGIQIPSLLNSGSEVTLLWQSYFNKHILTKIKLASGDKANTHTLFKLTVGNDGQMPIKMYTELDLTFLGLKVPNVGMLITEEPNKVLDKKHQTKLPGIVGWNLFQLSYNMFIQKYGTTGFDSFMCPEGVNPLLFSQWCIFHYSNVWNNKALGTTSEVMSQHIKISKSPKTDDLSKKSTNWILEEKMEL